MLGPLLFENRGAIVKNFVLQKKNFNSKKKFFQKSLFRKKKLFNENDFEKCCEAISTRKNQKNT